VNAVGESKAEVRHPIFARFFDRLSRLMERDIGERRDELLAGLSGRVVEIGAGNGMNFRHYPTTVEEVVALEPEAYLRGKAEQAARASPVRVTVREGVADPLPLEEKASTPLSHAWCCAPCRTRREHWGSCDGCSSQAASCASWSTCAPTARARLAFRSGSTAGASGLVWAVAATARATRSPQPKGPASVSNGYAASTSARRGWSPTRTCSGWRGRRRRLARREIHGAGWLPDVSGRR
jgi:hypothetical protein